MFNNTVVFEFVNTTLLPRVTGKVSIGNVCVTCHIYKSPPNHGMDDFDKLLLETEPVAHDNNVVLTSKLCLQASFMPYLTDNCSNWPLLPHFKPKILLNSADAIEAMKAF